MGIVLNYHCSCGYEREICIGAGRQALRTDTLPEFFSKETLADFYQAEAAGKISSHLCENVLAFCSACNEYHDIPLFHYTFKDETSRSLFGSCPVCGRSVMRLNETDTITCPNCLKPITARQVGHWD